MLKYGIVDFYVKSCLPQNNISRLRGGSVKVRETAVVGIHHLFSSILAGISGNGMGDGVASRVSGSYSVIFSIHDFSFLWFVGLSPGNTTQVLSCWLVDELLSY